MAIGGASAAVIFLVRTASTKSALCFAVKFERRPINSSSCHHGAGERSAMTTLGVARMLADVSHPEVCSSGLPRVCQAVWLSPWLPGVCFASRSGIRGFECFVWNTDCSPVGDLGVFP